MGLLTFYAGLGCLVRNFGLCSGCLFVGDLWLELVLWVVVFLTSIVRFGFIAGVLDLLCGRLCYCILFYLFRLILCYYFLLFCLVYCGLVYLLGLGLGGY